MKTRILWGLLGAVLGAALAAAAQNISRINGEVRDAEGKPYPDVIVILKHDESGLAQEQKTDKHGRFTQGGLRAGIYTVSVKVRDQIVYEMKTRVATGGEQYVHINFKEIYAQQQAAAGEERKKQEEEAKKFGAMKGHFDAGVAALAEAGQVRTTWQRTPAEQRAPLQEQLNQLTATAITEFQEAEKAAGPTDSNLHLIYAKLGESLDMAGRFEEAAGAYQKAIERRPTDAGYYNNLGNVLAKLGKVDEAGAAYQKSVELDPVNAANAWRNFGIVLYNNGKTKEAVEPLKKATQLDPSNAVTWYLLGASLVAAMEYKKEGDKFITVVQPGTAEAYQKYLDLAPNGPYAQQAKESLAMLETLGAGIQTKVRTKKK